MKKSLLITAAALILGTVGAAFAQTASHQVHVRIPSILEIRLTSAGPGTNPITNGDVMFDFLSGTGLNTYETTVASGGGWLSPIGNAAAGEVKFGDVKVFSNAAVPWKVQVSASVSSGTFLLSNVQVVPQGTIGTGVNALPSTFGLSTTAATIAHGSKTHGWSSLGFGGADYQVYVDGTEDPGNTVINVVYTISAP